MVERPTPFVDPIAEENRLHEASVAGSQATIETIKLRAGGGMSRAALRRIYGADLVDEVFAGMAPQTRKERP